MLGLIAEHTGQPRGRRSSADALRDRWFTAEEARDYGFVDQIVSDVADVTPGRRRAHDRAGGG